MRSKQKFQYIELIFLEVLYFLTKENLLI